MQDLDIEKFSPTRAELSKMAEEAQAITEASTPEAIKEMRLRLRTARTDIAKRGKEAREDAVKFQRAVIAKEKELIAIIEPHEERLDEIEELQERQRIIEERREFLPRRKERLAALQDGIEVSDEILLGMDGAEFEGYFNKRLADKNEAERVKIEEEKAQLEQDKRAAAREQELRDAEEKGRKEAAEKLEREQKEKTEREAREKKEKEERDEQEKLEKEEREREEKEKRERDERYQNFLKSHGYNSKEFYTTQDIGGVITLWKKVAVYDPNENA